MDYRIKNALYTSTEIKKIQGGRNIKENEN